MSGRASHLRPSVHSVARKAGVSVGTVSRVINRREGVDAEIRDRVLAASRELRFVPKVQRQTIAIVIGRTSPFSPVGYVSSMLAALVKELAKHDYLAEAVEMNNLDPAREAHVDGVIGVVFDERIRALKQLPNLPILTINEPMLDIGIHSVRTDHAQQAKLATEHLLSRGHRRIAFLENEPSNWASRERLAAYRSALRAAGIEFDPTLVGYVIGLPLYDTLGRLVRAGMTGLVNFSEDASLEASYVLTQVMKLSIPGDVSVVAMENIPLFKYLSPPHTVITQPLDGVVRIAVEQMKALCESKTVGKPPVDIVLPCTLIERESVSKLSSSGLETLTSTRR